MTLEEAVEILNQERHEIGEGAEWLVATANRVENTETLQWFNAFESIAVAEKYERERMRKERAQEAREEFLDAFELTAEEHTGR